MALQGLLFPPATIRAQNTERPPADLLARTNMVFETASYHFGGGYNNFNPGAGFEYRLSRHFHAGAGLYKNSIEELSVYALGGVETNGRRFMGAGIEVGVVSGYTEGIIPSAMPYLRLGRRDGRVNIKINAIPEIKNVTPAVVAAQVRVRLASPGKYGAVF